MCATMIQAPGYFHGDDDSLVDRLIEASQQSFKVKAKPALTHLVGRQLQPFQFDDVLDQPVTPVRNARLAKRHGSPPELRQRTDSKKSSPNMIQRPGPKKCSNTGATPLTADAVVNVDVQPRACNNPVGAIGSTSKNASPSVMPHACPKMFTSPKPEFVPTPSSALLRRANYWAAQNAITAHACAVVA